MNKLKAIMTCDNLLKQIIRERPMRVYELLTSLNIFSRNNAVLLSLYSFGYSMGGLEYELRKHLERADLYFVLDYLTKKYFKYVKKELMMPGKTKEQEREMLRGIAFDIGSDSQLVQSILNDKDENAISILTTSFLQRIGIPFYEVHDESRPELENSIKEIIDFQSLDYRLLGIR